jgi:hypothetical protein
MFEIIRTIFLFSLLFLSGLVLFVFSIEVVTRIYGKVIFDELKKRIKRNPMIGVEDRDGNLVLQKGRYTVKYRMVNSGAGSGQNTIKLVVMKIRLMGYEREINDFERGVRRFWVNREWAAFLVPKVFFLLFAVIAVLYFGLFESQSVKADQFGWIVSKILRMDKGRVSIKPNGWIMISGQRLTAVDKKFEDVSYNVNLLDWLMFKDSGYIVRDRGVVEGKDYGHVEYPVRYGDDGRIRLEKDGKWIRGNSDEDGMGMEWKKAQGTGIREGQVLGDEEDDNAHPKNNQFLFDDK